MNRDYSDGKKVTVIGAAVVDIMAGPVDKSLFDKGSVPAENMGISCGGDALNESVILSKLGMDTELVTLVGNDGASEMIFKCLRDNGISADKVAVDEGIVTGTNIVLVDGDGERSFITNPVSSLRKLSKEPILAHVDDMGDIVSFASIFVSPMLKVEDMAEVFAKIKEKPGRILVADMTTAKNGEKIGDLEPILKYIDYIIPNEKEAMLLTGEADPEAAARSFIEHGAKCVIIKCGKKGCLYARADGALGQGSNADGAVSRSNADAALGKGSNADGDGSRSNADSIEMGSVAAFPAKVIDTTGAGDSFVAGFIYGLAGGNSLADCCRLGCAVASIVVEHLGTQGFDLDLKELNLPN